MFLEKQPVKALAPFVSLYGLKPPVITEFGKSYSSSGFILVANICLNLSIQGIQNSVRNSPLPHINHR